jgi:hypothetical protein
MRLLIPMLMPILIVAIGGPSPLAAQRVSGAPVAGQRQTDDSAAVLLAAWRFASGPHAGLRPVSLWLPTQAGDTAARSFSPRVRALLAAASVPLRTQSSAGDDTVVFRITTWTPDTLGVVVGVRSSWTTVLGTGPGRCRTSSGNVERVRVSYQSMQSVATHLGPIAHGDAVCVAIK